MNIRNILSLIFVLFSAAMVAAQHEHHTPPEDKEKDPADHSMHTANPASDFLMSQAAGTAVPPQAASSAMSMKSLGNWNLMTHGYVYLNGIVQSGQRGEDEFFSSNHLMLMLERQPDATSSILIRGMFSLEPATVAGGYYPLLFQTGETADGEAIIDGQHPHDLFMELSAQYALQLNENTLIHFYAGLRGDPALGPVAFPHRISAQELPQATLSHHLQDSTHIADDVLTAGIRYKQIRMEFSGFHGAEPDEDRWDLDQGAIDSWSTRFTWTPSKEWTAQISTGRLNEPEELEPGDIQRTTASVTHYQDRSDGFWTSSFVWGSNYKFEEDRRIHSWLFETLWQFRNKNYLTGRFESVDKDELFGHDEDEHEPNDLADKVFRVYAATFGYARDFDLIPQYQTGVGADVTFYSMPDALEPFYGETPAGFFVYFRIRFGQHAH